ncbi:DUF4238 domain-containing protein [archaeon]|nr:DUF4238 domain-containing protein [archaeon]
MATRKRQHYVPQFYLGYFSNKPKHIFMYNLKREMHKSVPIKGACSINYFYGKNLAIEDSLSKFEYFASSILRKIQVNENLTCLDEKELINLFNFILFQRGRTEVSQKKMIESADFLYKEALIPMMLNDKKIIEAGITKEKLEKYKLSSPNPILTPLLIHLQSGPLIADLHPALLINKSNTNFITSDNPVILFNPFFNNLQGIGADGFRSKGITIIYPLNSKLMIMLFDSKYYNFSRLKDDFTLKVSKNKDIRRINGLQMINCNHNVFFEDENQIKDIKLQHKELSSKRSSKYVKPEKYKTDDPNKEILHLKNRKYNYNFDLSFIITKENVDKTHGDRDPEFTKFYQEFMKKHFAKKVQK